MVSVVGAVAPWEEALFVQWSKYLLLFWTYCTALTFFITTQGDWWLMVCKFCDCVVNYIKLEGQLIENGNRCFKRTIAMKFFIFLVKLFIKSGWFT